MRFLPQRGVYLEALDQKKKWEFKPIARDGEVVEAGSFLGQVPEGIFDHKIMVPFSFQGKYTVEDIQAGGRVQSGRYDRHPQGREGNELET